VEYIISRRLYEGLPDDEKRFWHSHVYEVSTAPVGHCLSLLAPGLHLCAALESPSDRYSPVQ